MGEKIHLVMPMGGKGSRFSEKGFEFPKPLIELHGKPFFYWSVRSIEKFVEVKDIIFVVLQEHIDKFKIDTRIKEYFPNAVIHSIPQVLNGAVLTCLEALEEIHDDKPLIFNDCDHLFKSTSFNDFCNKGEFEKIDGALLTFKSRDNKYGYVKMDDEGKVNGTVEKKAVSDAAICGAYYFKDAGTFKSAVEQYLDKCEYMEFFISGVYNIMAAENKNLVKFDTDYHVPYGVPEEYDLAVKSERYQELL